MRGKRISLLRQRLAGDTPAAEVFPIGAKGPFNPFRC